MANCQNKCFISLAIKALKIRRKFKLYTAEKEYAKAGNENADVNKCLCTKFSKHFSSVNGNSSRSVKKTGIFNRFLVEDSIENFILKSVFGFLGGILLTYICFMFLVFSLNFTLHRATYICMGLGIILSLGLAFSVKIRCTVFLCIPQLFSKRGRQALLAYAFILALSGPAKNTLHNVEVMSESLACAQEQLKQAENELLKCVHKPNAAAKKSIEKLLEKLNFAVKDFKNFILQLYRNCFDILETVLQSQKWLYSITFLCHKKIGRPAHHCLDLLADSIENCQSMNPIPPWKELCKIDPRTQESICSSSATAFCLRSDVPEYLPVLKLQKQLDAFKHRAMNILYVKIEAHQTYSQTNRSYTYHEEYQGMATEIRQKTDQFLQYFDFMSVIFGIFILVLFVKVIIYRHKFLTEDHYDNRYITSDFVDIDNTRAEFQMETLLPLKPREKMKYIKVTSIRLVPCERVRLLSSFIFLIFATFKIIIHILTDSSLYWILSSVRRDERLLYMSTLREEEPSITVRVVGYGLVAALLRNVTRVVKRQSTTTRLDPTPCLPDPVPPDWNRYYQIFFLFSVALVIICWLLALCEPYGLRLRHTVMVTYHPDRARERAIWLYNRIISNRTSFVKISRREIRRKYKDVPREATFRYQFMKNTSSPKCLLCKNTISCNDNRVECPTVHCVGIYCAACFASLKFCSICRDPADYGDLSDLSEEKDSSEEECLNKFPPKNVTTPKKVETNDSKKEKFLLNFKKPNFKLKKECEKNKNQRKEKSTGKRLIQPTLLFRAVKYCRNKIPAFRQLRNLSDVESSDWDLNSTLCTDLSSSEKKPLEFRKSVYESRKKKEKRKRKDFSEKGSRKKGKKHEKETQNKRIKNSKKIEKALKKVCLFQKISPEGAVEADKDLTSQFDTSFETSEKPEERPKPDFLFRKVEKSAEVRSSHEDLPETFLKAKDSFESIKKKQKKQNFKSSNMKESSVGVLLVESTKLKDFEEFKTMKSFHAIEEDPQNTNNSLELDTGCSESEIQSRITFPFIDPINIHEFASVGGIWKPVELREKNVSNSAKEELTKEGKKESEESIKHVNVKNAAAKVPCTPSSARVCIKKSKSSQFFNEKVRLCVKDEASNSSTESDCQFYSQPYYSSISSSEPTESESIVKRASGKINLKKKAPKQSVFYSIETDSSNDKYLSVKPTQRVRKKLSKAKLLAEESDILLIILARSSGTSNSKDLDFLKAKTVRFCKKSLRENESSGEETSSDTDYLECESKMSFFLSDEEIQRISKRNSLQKIRKESTGIDRKSNHLEWPRWLLSELPFFYRQCFTDISADRK